MNENSDCVFSHYDFTAEGEAAMEAATEWFEAADFSFLFNQEPSDETRVYMIPPTRILLYMELHEALYKLAKIFGGKLDVKIDYKHHYCSFSLEVVMIDCDYKESYFLDAIMLSSKMDALLTDNGFIRFSFDFDLFKRIA